MCFPSVFQTKLSAQYNLSWSLSPLLPLFLLQTRTNNDFFSCGKLVTQTKFRGDTEHRIDFNFLIPVGLSSPL